jgi:hypothetical protein
MEVQPAAWPRCLSPARRRKLSQLMKPPHPRDVSLDGRAAGYATSNPLAETAAPTHRLVVKLENACGALANRAQEKRPFAAIGKAVVDDRDLASEPVIALAENDLNIGHDARSAQPRNANESKVILKQSVHGTMIPHYAAGALDPRDVCSEPLRLSPSQDKSRSSRPSRRGGINDVLRVSFNRTRWRYHFASGVLIAKLRGKYRRSSFVGWRFMVLSLAIPMSPAERALIERESYC